MAGRGGGPNTTHALPSPDPKTLPIGEGVPPSHRRVPGNQEGPRPTDTVTPCSLNGRSQLPSELEVGTRQLTLCPSGTNSLEPSPNLVPSDVPASGHHGFVKWGHDAKITKIGVIPTHGSPGQRKANDSQDERQDLGPISECPTWY